MRCVFVIATTVAVAVAVIVVVASVDAADATVNIYNIYLYIYIRLLLVAVNDYYNVCLLGVYVLFIYLFSRKMAIYPFIVPGSIIHLCNYNQTNWWPHIIELVHRYIYNNN